MTSLLKRGVWSFPSNMFPDERNYMFIDPARMRIVTFVAMTAEPVRRVAMPAWYQQHTPGIILARTLAMSEWQTHHYRTEGDNICWKFRADVVEEIWIPVEHLGIPDWIEEKREKAYAKMDLRESESKS